MLYGDHRQKSSGLQRALRDARDTYRQYSGADLANPRAPQPVTQPEPQAPPSLLPAAARARQAARGLRERLGATLEEVRARVRPSRSSAGPSRVPAPMAGGPGTGRRTERREHLRRAR
jgi:hypothetical protein